MANSRLLISRRNMLRLAAAAVAAPVVVPSTVFGQNAPSETMLMGSIGNGRMGHGDMKEAVYRGMKTNARVVAVCDVDSNRAAHARDAVEGIYTKEYGKGKFTPVKVYGDYHELLARKDIDGVTISTPDHQHAVMAVAAAKAKKDMYIQKPLTYSIGEGKALVKAVRDNKVILQTGSQQRSEVHFRRTCEWVRNGHLGKLQTIEVVVPTDHGTGKNVTMPVPKNLNYDMWLGPRAVAPYTEHRVHPQKDYGRPGWLQIEQYCRGMITGWGAHMYDIAQWALGTDMDSGPVEIQAKADFPTRGLFDVHTNYSAEAMYANGVKMTSKNGSAGVKFTGERGWIRVWRNQFAAEPKTLLREKIAEDGIHLPVSVNHMLNFLESMRKHEDPIAPVEAGHRSNSVCVLHHIAMKLGRKLKWDPKAEQFINDAAANKMLDYSHRKPYTV